MDEKQERMNPDNRQSMDPDNRQSVDPDNRQSVYPELKDSEMKKYNEVTSRVDDITIDCVSIQDSEQISESIDETNVEVAFPPKSPATEGKHSLGCNDTSHTYLSENEELNAGQDNLNGNEFASEQVVTKDSETNELLADSLLDTSKCAIAKDNKNEEMNTKQDNHLGGSELAITKDNEIEELNETRYDSDGRQSVDDYYPNDDDEDEMIIVIEDHQDGADSDSQCTDDGGNDVDGNDARIETSPKAMENKFPRIKFKNLDELFPNPSAEKIRSSHNKKQTLDSLFPVNRNSDVDDDDDEVEKSSKVDISKRMDQILLLNQNTDTSDLDENDMTNNDGGRTSPVENLEMISPNTNQGSTSDPTEKSPEAIVSNITWEGPDAQKPLLIQPLIPQQSLIKNLNKNSVLVEAPSKTFISLKDILKNIDDDTIIELEFYEDDVIMTSEKENVTRDAKHIVSSRKKTWQFELPTWPPKVEESPKLAVKSRELPTLATTAAAAGESSMNIHFQNATMLATSGQPVLHQYKQLSSPEPNLQQPQYRQILPRPNTTENSTSSSIATTITTSSLSTETGAVPYNPAEVTRMDHNDVPFSGMIYSNSGTGFVPLYQQMQVDPPNRMFEFDPTKRFACGICGKGFHQASSVKTHMRLHTGSKPYKCDICGKGFNQSGNLRNHRRVHTGEKPYKCKYCGKGFSQVGNRQHHVRTHTGEKPFKCRLCNRGFNQSSDLQKHFRTHTGEKPYKCMVCSKAFNSSSNLQRHLRTHV